MFDWEYEHMPEETRYTTFRTGTVGGGFPDLGDMYEPDDVVLYIESNDIDADLGRAGRLGATTAIPKTEIPGMGRFAFFRDPTGNRIGLFQNNAG
jgi:predicted enzyme related to lactoylglutathione lyase